jgi:hypothetical protein
MTLWPAIRYGMDRGLLNRMLLTFVWTFVVFNVVSLGTALFSVYPSDPFFIGFAILIALSVVAAILTSMGKVVGWYVGLLYVILSVSSWGWLTFHQSSAWRGSLIWYIASDLLFGATVYLTVRTTSKVRK